MGRKKSEHAAAIASGAATFETGRPCKRGHTSARNRWGACLTCVSDYSKSPSRRQVRREKKRALCATEEGRLKANEIARNSRARHVDAARARVRVWKAKNAARVSSYAVTYYDANKTYFAAKSAETYEAKKKTGAASAYQRERYKVAPEIFRARSDRRRALEVGAVSTLTSEELAELRLAHGDRCAYCLEVKPLTTEHVKPLSSAGANSADNITFACRSCNSRKRNKPLLVFLLETSL